MQFPLSRPYFQRLNNRRPKVWAIFGRLFGQSTLKLIHCSQRQQTLIGLFCVVRGHLIGAVSGDSFDLFGRASRFGKTHGGGLSQTMKDQIIRQASLARGILELVFEVIGLERLPRGGVEIFRQNLCS